MKMQWISRVLLLTACSVGLGASAALRPEGDKIEFSPLQEELKVAPLTGTDLDRPKFNFQNREPGASVSDVPMATMALPSPDQVNRLKALQEWIDERASWAAPGGDNDDPDELLSLRPRAADSDITIDDLFERRSRLGGGLDRFGDSDRNGLDRERESDFDRASRDRRGLNNRDMRDRDDLLGRSGMELGTDAESLGSGRERDPLDPSRGRRDATGVVRDTLNGNRREVSDGFLEFRSLVPGGAGLMKDRLGEAASTREDRLESLRRVLGNTAPNILGPASGRAGTGDPLSGAGVLGTMGSVPGANRSLSESLDSRFGGSASTPAKEDPVGGVQRLTLPTSRPFELDLATGREGFGSRSERLPLSPPPTPMEMFRKKHDARLPTRDF